MALVKAGLWEKQVQLSSIGEIDFDDILRIADEQSVVGLVTAGIEHVVDVKVPQDDVLQICGNDVLGRELQDHELDKRKRKKRIV